ncbi:MAG: hypothetical protein Q4D98_05395 [Planctomycetia bacterium]|nr:hypothetical protein [Planctomycetia bacterium]
MKKKIRWLLLILIGLIGLGAGTAWLVWRGVHCEPAFYRDLAVTDANRDKAIQDARTMFRKVAHLRNRMEKKGKWSLEMTQDELNHWVELDLEAKHPGFLSRRVRYPRVQINGGQLRCGATIDAREYQGVASVDIVPSMEAPNIVNIEFRTIRAGVVPLPRKILLDLATEKARELALPIDWRQHNGNPVLRMAFSENELRYGDHPIVLHQVTVKDGKIIIVGETLQ